VASEREKESSKAFIILFLAAFSNNNAAPKEVFARRKCCSLKRFVKAGGEMSKNALFHIKAAS